MKKLLLILIIPFLSFGQIDPVELCDSIFVSFIEYNEDLSYVEIGVSTEFLSSYWFPYAGFMLTNYEGDTLATETLGSAGNVYGLGSNMTETRYLQIIDDFSLQFNGTIHLVNFLFAGTPETICSWPFNISNMYIQELPYNKSVIKTLNLLVSNP